MRPPGRDLPEQPPARRGLGGHARRHVPAIELAVSKQRAEHAGKEALGVGDARDDVASDSRRRVRFHAGEPRANLLGRRRRRGRAAAAVAAAIRAERRNDGVVRRVADLAAGRGSCSKEILKRLRRGPT